MRFQTNHTKFSISIHSIDLKWKFIETIRVLNIMLWFLFSCLSFAISFDGNRKGNNKLVRNENIQIDFRIRVSFAVYRWNIFDCHYKNTLLRRPAKPYKERFKRVKFDIQCNIRIWQADIGGEQQQKNNIARLKYKKMNTSDDLNQSC